MELQELHGQIFDRIKPEDSDTTLTLQDLAHEQLQGLYDEIYHEDMTPNEQCFFKDASSQITSQGPCR
jgi:hypothetical protein